MLTDRRVTFCVDTNILVEFKALDQIPWREIAPNAAEIRIVVMTKVAEELDEHKKKTGRLRRRGLEFAQFARRIEESQDNRAILRERDPQVTIEFGPIYRRTELDHDLYDLDDKDGRIVAEAAKFMADHPDAVLLGDDGKPLRLARQTALLWRRPPESWRRDDGPDERDTEIAELKRELGAQPAFSISFPGAANDRREHILEPAPVAACVACSDRLVSAVLAADPKIPRAESVARYGVARPDPMRMSSFIDSLGKLTRSDLDHYDNEYTEFEKRARSLVDELPALFRAIGFVLPIDIRVANDGHRAAERVLVQLKLTGAFHFVSRDFFEGIMDRLLRPPSPPKPNDPMNMEPFPVSGPEKPHVFYLLEDPKGDGSTTSLEWRCEEFRHGQRFILPAIVRSKDEGARGALKVCVSSATMAKTAETTAPLVPFGGDADENRLCTYLLRRVELFRLRYQEPLRLAIAEARQGCSGGSPQPHRSDDPAT